MSIPLPSMLRAWRERDFAEGKRSRTERFALKAWAFAAKRPRLYQALAAVGGPLLTRLAGGRGRLSRLPFAQPWTKLRELPAPEGRTFQQLYAKVQKDRK
jgi:L-lactate dehydrogenase complex protein LldF